MDVPYALQSDAECTRYSTSIDKPFDFYSPQSQAAKPLFQLISSRVVCCRIILVHFSTSTVSMCLINSRPQITNERFVPAGKLYMVKSKAHHQHLQTSCNTTPALQCTSFNCVCTLSLCRFIAIDKDKRWIYKLHTIYSQPAAFNQFDTWECICRSMISS